MRENMSFIVAWYTLASVFASIICHIVNDIFPLFYFGLIVELYFVK